MIYKRIQTLRKLKGFSQKDMADKLHKSPSAYSRMENGEIKIALEELPGIAEILDCSVDDLIQDLTRINIQQNNEKAFADIQNYNDNSEEMLQQFQTLMNQVLEYQARSEERTHNLMKEIMER